MMKKKIAACFLAALMVCAACPAAWADGLPASPTPAPVTDPAPAADPAPDAGGAADPAADSAPATEPYAFDGDAHRYWPPACSRPRFRCRAAMRF
ncbi:MAG: hypothetical protein ACLVKK_12450 [Ruthenibacterium sp.]